MSEPNAKLGRILSILATPGGPERRNPDIAREVGCDEGMVRRARHIAQINGLLKTIATIEAENARLHEQLRNIEPPKPVTRRKRHPAGPLPLFRETRDGETFATDLPFIDVP